MRRQINKSSIIIILIVALFTLLSYSFDQLVIRNEDKLRNTQIKLDNIITELDNFESLNTQLISFSDYTLRNYVQLKRYNKYWLKSLIINTDHEKTNLLKKYKIEKFSKEHDNELVYQRLIEHFRYIFAENNTLRQKNSQIYYWHKELFNGEPYEVNWDSLLEKLNKNKDDIYYYVKIAKASKDAEERKKIIKNMDLDDWYELYQVGNEIIKEMLNYHYYIEKDIVKVEKMIDKLSRSRDATVEKISKISSNKNYYILSSIISQIFSLLFLLVLFRVLIKR